MPRKNKSNIDVSPDKGNDLESMVAKLASRFDIMQNNFEQMMLRLMPKEPTVSPAVENKCNLEGEKSKLNNYIALWKDLGGYSLHFSPKGGIHPKDFVKKARDICVDAGVPENKRVELVISCLRGSAQDWAVTKRDCFVALERFIEMFLERYWGVEQERELFFNIKYGRYESGSKADYFLKMAKEAAYLDTKLPEETLVRYLSKHFSNEIQRGILNAGLKDIGGVEGHLREIDNTYEEGTNNQRNNCQNRRNNNNHVQNNRGNGSSGINNNNWRRDRENNNDNSREINLVDTVGGEELLSDSEKEDATRARKMSCPTISLEVFGEATEALIDSGSEITAVSEQFFKVVSKSTNGLPILPVVGITVRGAVGTKEQKIKQQVLLKVIVEATMEMDIVCLVVPGLVRPMVLGCDWLSQYKARLDFIASLLTVTDDHLTYSIRLRMVEGWPQRLTIAEVSETEEKNVESVQVEKSTFLEGDSCNLDTEHEKKLKELIRSYEDVFSDKPGLITEYQHVIKMRDETPFFVKPYPIPYAYRKETDRQIAEMLELGIIEPAQTAFVSPLVCVKKKDGLPRLCLDARTLNTRMEKDHVLPPSSEQLLEKYDGEPWLSTLDLTSSYWQIPIREQDRKYTGFSYGNYIYQFRVLPFGLSTSVASFIRGLNRILGPELLRFTIPYVDDLLIFSKTPDEHLEHLGAILQRFREANITLKLSKCKFAKSKVLYVGHILSAGGIRVDPAKTSAILNFPQPRNVKELRSFLGLINYHRRFIKDFSILALPLYELLKKNAIWSWRQREAESFAALKASLAQVVEVCYPKKQGTFIIQTDSSDSGLGACLSQEQQEEGEVRIIAFASRTLRGPEKNYTVTEKETLAIIFALKTWRTYVLGRPLILKTDHKALTFLLSCRLLSARLTRWILFLQEYQFSIEYCPGKENIVADTLSRFPEDLNEKVEPQPETHKVEVMSIAKEFQMPLDLRKKFRSMATEQGKDPWCGKIKSTMTEEKVSKWYFVQDGVLYKRGDPTIPDVKLCVPSHLVLDIVKFYHETSGHFGNQKCFQMLRRNLIWPKMSRTIRKIIASCEICQKTKPIKPLLLETFSIVPSEKGELVSLDLVGPLPMSRSGVTQLCVVVDVFTKFVKLYPLKRATTTAILNRLERDYFLQFGVPKMLLSDNGTQFCSKRWTEVLRKWGVKIVHTSVYHPQGNPTERVNREIVRLFRLVCHRNHTGWATRCKEVEHWLNHAIHITTGFTPHELQYGQNQINIWDKYIQFPKIHESGLENRMLVAKERLVKAAERRKKLGVGIPFKEDDLVLVRDHSQSSAEDKTIKKFFLLYTGPYRISQVIGPNCFKVTTLEGREIGRHHASNLRKFVPPLETLT